MASEDDTFNRLCRRPFDEVYHEVILMLRNKKALDVRDAEIDNYVISKGWTVDEFKNELVKFHTTRLL